MPRARLTPLRTLGVPGSVSFGPAEDLRGTIAMRCNLSSYRTHTLVLRDERPSLSYPEVCSSFTEITALIMALISTELWLEESKPSSSCKLSFAKFIYLSLVCLVGE